MLVLGVVSSVSSVLLVLMVSVLVVSVLVLVSSVLVGSDGAAANTTIETASVGRRGVEGRGSIDAAGLRVRFCSAFAFRGSFFKGGVLSVSGLLAPLAGLLWFSLMDSRESMEGVWCVTPRPSRQWPEHP